MEGARARAFDVWGYRDGLEAMRRAVLDIFDGALRDLCRDSTFVMDGRVAEAFRSVRSAVVDVRIEDVVRREEDQRERVHRDLVLGLADHVARLVVAADGRDAFLTNDTVAVANRARVMLDCTVARVLGVEVLDSVRADVSSWQGPLVAPPPDVDDPDDGVSCAVLACRARLASLPTDDLRAVREALLSFQRSRAEEVPVV